MEEAPKDRAEKTEEHIGRFRLILHRGINTLHEFWWTWSTVCVQVASTVVTMHTICEGRFLGPIFAYRNQRKDFQYFWQSVSRENAALEHFKHIETDEGQELYNGIMPKTKNSTHFLCLSHVRQNIEKKLSEFLIPNMLKYGILEDMV